MVKTSINVVMLLLAMLLVYSSHSNIVSGHQQRVDLVTYSVDAIITH